MLDRRFYAKCPLICYLFLLQQLLPTKTLHATGIQLLNGSIDLHVIGGCLPLSPIEIKNASETTLVQSGYTNFWLSVNVTDSGEGCSKRDLLRVAANRWNQLKMPRSRPVTFIIMSDGSEDSENNISPVIFLRPDKQFFLEFGRHNPIFSEVDVDDWFIQGAIACVEYFGWKSFSIFSSNEPRWKILSNRLELALRRRNYVVLSRSKNSSEIPKFNSDLPKAVFICAPFHSLLWKQLDASINEHVNETLPMKAIITFHETIDMIHPSFLPNITSAAVFVISSMDTSNRLKNITAIETDSKQTRVRILEKIIHATNLAAAILNTKAYSNFTGQLLRLASSPFYSVSNESILVQLNDEHIIEYSFQGSQQYLLMRHLQLCLFQWLPDRRLYFKVLESKFDHLQSNSTPINILQQVNTIFWPNGVIPQQDFCETITNCAVYDANYRRRMRKRRENRGPNKILYQPEEITMSNGTTKERASFASASSALSRPPISSVRVNSHITSPALENLASFNGELIHLRNLSLSSMMETFVVKRKALDVLSSLRSLRHENVNNLWGCLCHKTKPALMFNYCSRGTLHEIIHNQEKTKTTDLSSDWPFRLSLVFDLVRGMRYLHGENLCHGRLTSHNCVIDSHWVLKITDYSLLLFYQAQGLQIVPQRAKELLWTAPEILRLERLTNGSQPGDVYSFAIIVQEVVTREEPFSMINLAAEEILAKIRKPPPLIRPSVSKGIPYPEIIDLMRQCWAETPDSRPNFNSIYDTVKKLYEGKKVNIVDHMNEMLENYSNNLEDLIKARTEELDAEKKKTEQLLNQMLPSSVTKKLKIGHPIDPEEFHEVTIYFSDIVGFTSLSAESTPMQVVNLLNDLYTCFDAIIENFDVYKVETIGDAYMVVSGLPVRNGNLHAREVARMSLCLLNAVTHFRIRHRPNDQLRLRIGIHSGPCVAGVVGLKMPRYCLFGDTVNTASRMESNGLALKIHVSPFTKAILDEFGSFVLEQRGDIEIKGKGVMTTFWLLGENKTNS